MAKSKSNNKTAKTSKKSTKAKTSTKKMSSSSKKTTKTTAPSVSSTSTVTVSSSTTQVSTTSSSTAPVVPAVTYSTVLESISGMATMLKTLKSQVKSLEKQNMKQAKELEKSKTKSSRKSTKRAPSGFAKPAPISKDLCKFLGKPLDTEIARTEVTKHLTAYIKEKGLQNPANKKQIKPDAALSKLLGTLQPEDKAKGYTYFNLQKYMKHHFPKSVKASTSS